MIGVFSSFRLSMDDVVQGRRVRGGGRQDPAMVTRVYTRTLRTSAPPTLVHPRGRPYRPLLPPASPASHGRPYRAIPRYRAGARSRPQCSSPPSQPPSVFRSTDIRLRQGPGVSGQMSLGGGCYGFRGGGDRAALMTALMALDAHSPIVRAPSEVFCFVFVAPSHCFLSGPL